MSTEELQELYTQNMENMMAIRNNITKASTNAHSIMVHMFNAMLEDQYRIGDRISRALAVRQTR